MKRIEVTIAGRPFPLKVEENEETLVMQVVDEINQKVRDFQKTYRNKDRQDCLSMALLTYAIEYNKVKGQDNVLAEIKAKSASIQAVLEQVS
ncbi:MAG: cell division protein ZapA [Saprospiraceae bacterium]|nr:cell division protein ZapA [Saprospiraceae bacterium]